MIIQKESSAINEMNRKRWLIRYLILFTIGIILVIKTYFMLFIIDFTIGFYSFLTTVVLFTIFLFSYLKFKDPLLKIKEKSIDIDPLISVIITVKNEEENIENCVQSVINTSCKNKERIVVNDGSTDKSPNILGKVKKEYPDL